MKRSIKSCPVFALPMIVIASLVGAPVVQSANAQAIVSPEDARFEWAGTATFQFDAHIYGSGFKDGEPEFITRYTPLRSFSGDDFPGYYVDISHIKADLVDLENGRRVFGVERTAFGYFNQKNALYFDPEPIRLDIFHSLYRSQQFRSANEPDPASAGGNNIFAVFNDDSFGRKNYFVQRNDVDVNLRLRPSAFAHDGSHMGNVNMFYHRSDRESVRYFDYIITARLATGSNNHQSRWRGIDQRVIEDVNRGGIALSATPFRWIGVHYEFTAERYEHQYRNSTLADVARVGNVPVYGGSTGAPNPPGFQEPSRNDFWPLNQTSLGFVPSSTKLVNKIRFEKPIGAAILNFGYSNVFLDQDEFTMFARDRGFERGRIVTNHAFANLNAPVAHNVLWNAHLLYRNRDNQSTFPALDPMARIIDPVTGNPINRPGGVNTVFDYANPLLDGGLHGGIFGPFINQVETYKFGTDLTFAFPVASSRVVAGWEREDTSRDLIFGDPLSGATRTIDPNEAFVRPNSVNDTFFANLSTRPVRNLRLRWNNSLTIGDEVGLVTEAEKGWKSRIGAGYFMPNVLHGATTDVFYQVRYSENNDFIITSDATTPGSDATARQEREELFQSAGVTVTVLPSEAWTTYVGYVWNRDSLEANYMRTSQRRYEAAWGFTSVTRSRYMTDAHTVFLGSSYAFTPQWIGTVDYTVTAIRGDLGSGDVEGVLGADNELKNTTQHVQAGLTYNIKPNWTVGTRYTYAVYRDQVESDFNSEYHTVGLFASLAF